MTDQAPDSPATDSAASKPGKRKSRWPKKTLIAAVVIGGILIGLPYLIGYVIKQALINAGAESAHVEDIDFNMFRGDIKVDRLHVKAPGLPEVILNNAYADLDWSALLNKHIVVERLEIHDVDIRVEKNADGSINVIGLEVVPPGEAEGAPTEQQDGTIPFIDGAGVALFEILDVNLVYVDPALDLTLQIDSLTVESVYSWEADSAAQLEFKGSLNDSPITISATVKAFGESQSADVNIKVDTLDLNAFEKLAGDAIPTLAGKLGLDTDLTMSYQKDLISLHNEGRVEIKDLNLAFEGGRVQDKDIDWTGNTDLSLTLPDEGAEMLPPIIKNKSTLSSAALTVELTEPAINIDGKQLHWDGSMEHDQTGISSLLVNGAISLGATSVKMSGEQPLEAAVTEIKVSDLQVKGTETITVGGLKVSGTSVEMSGDTALKASVDSVQASAFSMAGPEQIGLGSVEIAGIETTIPGDAPLSAKVASASTTDLKIVNSEQISATGQAIKGLQITDTGANIDLAMIGDISVSQIDVNGAETIKLGNIKASDLNALVAQGKGDKAAKLFTAKGLDVVALGVENGDEIAIKSVELKDSNTNLSRLENGKWLLLDDLSGAGKEPAAATADAKPAAGNAEAAAASDEKAPLKLRMGELKFTGENALHYADATVAPAADIDIIIDALSITDIDSSSPSATPNKFKLAARVGKYGKINSDGSLRPLSTPPVADLKLKVDGVDLKVASPILAGAVGYIVESGSIDLDTTFKVDPKGDMSGENRIKLTQLVLKPGDEKVMAKVNESSPMPLDAALDLLRDKNNVIEMDIPISGNINDPNVDVSDAIGQAIGSIAGTAAMAALTTVGPAAALGPIGLVAIVGKMGVDQLSKVRLASVEYAPGGIDPTADIAKDMKAAADVLAADEKLSLRLCPFYTLEDAQALASKDGTANKQRSPLSTHQQAVTELSQQRAEALKDRLIKEFKLEPKRILTCTPELDDGASAKPRVEFGL